MDTTQTNTTQHALFQALHGILQEHLLAFLPTLPPAAGAVRAVPPPALAAPSTSQGNRISPKGSNTPILYAQVVGTQYAVTDKATTTANDGDFLQG